MGEKKREYLVCSIDGDLDRFDDRRDAQNAVLSMLKEGYAPDDITVYEGSRVPVSIEIEHHVTFGKDEDDETV